MDEMHEPAFAPQARARLAELGERVQAAVAGLGAGASWFAAAVDQHAAEVRDAIADRSGRMPVVRLAAYADGVLDTAERRGWRLEPATAPSWPLLRLSAVSSLSATAV
ncbi:DUF6401 family natural product biosynthesis protein [Dactylosporangium matsuzakiense]|uniref:Uncharacterized protein n=1 Tax=Dactylosporangium matsuzakiense TaxID=53360 RepID=A0A9W6KXQ7_9ACTN|nr:DUF6401 family natural product biosynthesis protein [Dactylosporangium matsuzakiense]UWZ48663.1 hypothetical protein Dmats_21000 [Dactylosporangium matsuzakiense]GLL08629.1 hypothetical protein GCM10017581_103960 [Dactylosporangium matsuzakiense]